MKAVVVEDEIPIRRNICRMIRQYTPQVEIVGEAGDIHTAEKVIRETWPDLLLLDIELHKETAFDLLKNLLDMTFKIIFVTAHKKYSYQAIKVETMDFLMKPISSFELRKAIAKVEKQLRLEEPTAIRNYYYQDPSGEIRLRYKTKEGMKFIYVKDIIWIKASRMYCEIIIDNSISTKLRRNISELEKQLTPYGILRINRSVMVNPKYITEVKTKTQFRVRVLKFNKTYPVSKKYQERVLGALSAEEI